jgi:hypothetical protein
MSSDAGHHKDQNLDAMPLNPDIAQLLWDYRRDGLRPADLAAVWVEQFRT